MLHVDAYYDAVVIGRGLPQLAAALALSRGGARTLIVPVAEADPFKTFIPGVGEPPFIEGIDFAGLVRSLGISFSEMRRVKMVQPSFQFLWPNKRFELFADEAALTASLTREFDVTDAEIATWCGASEAAHHRARELSQELWHLQSLPPKSVRSRLAYRQIQAAIKPGQPGLNCNHPLFGNVAKALSLLTTHALAPLPMQAGQIDWLVAIARFGSLDKMALKKLFVEQVKAQAIDSLKPGQLSTIHFERRQPDTLTLNEGHLDRIRFNYLLTTVGVDELATHFENPKAWQPLLSWFKRRPPVLDRYSLPITLAKEGLPVGMAKRTIFNANPSAPLLGANLVGIDVDDSDQERAVLWCRFVVEHGSPVSAELLKQVSATLADGIPFLAENQIDPFLAAKKEAELSLLEGSHQYFRLQGLGPTTPTKQFILAGQNNLPELGQEGAILSAIKAAQLILERLGLARQPSLTARNSISL